MQEQVKTKCIQVIDFLDELVLPVSSATFLTCMALSAHYAYIEKITRATIYCGGAVGSGAIFACSLVSALRECRKVPETPVASDCEADDEGEDFSEISVLIENEVDSENTMFVNSKFTFP